MIASFDSGVNYSLFRSELSLLSSFLSIFIIKASKTGVTSCVSSRHADPGTFLDPG